MRYFYSLLFLTFLCTSVRAQLNVTANLGLKDDFCSATVTDPNVDCTNVPNGNNTLTYIPGEDGEILITYRLINFSGKRIVELQFDDSIYGEVFPRSPTNILPGAIVPANFIYPARTSSGTFTSTITLSVAYANGSRETVTNTYTINVVAPEVTTDFSLVRKIDACPDADTAPNCGTSNYGNLTLTLGPTDTFVTRFNWENTGASTFDQSLLIDQDGDQLASTGFDQVPGQTLISALFFEAPALPGTYNYSQTITVTDFAGNTDNATVNYTIIVQGPSVDTDFSMVRKLEACPEAESAGGCGPTNYGTFSITVGPTDTVVTRFNWENTSLGTIDRSALFDQDGEELAATGFNQVTGQTLIAPQFIIAPSEIGTHNFSQTITVTDLGGNAISETINYTIVVQGPSVDTDFSIVRKIDACPEAESAGECGPTNYGALSITVGPTDTVVTRFNWENTSLGTIDRSALFDQDGVELAATGFNQVTGQTLISPEFIIAPSEIGTHNFSQTITVTDFGGNSISETINYTIVVQGPSVDTDFSLVRKADACPDALTPGDCGTTNYGNRSITVGAGDTLVTRFNWENTSLGTIDRSVLVDQDGVELAATGFNQVTGQTLISPEFIIAPGEPGTYNLKQTITVTDFGGNTTSESIDYQVTVDCALGDLVAPVARCRNRSFTITEGETLTINAGQIDDRSFDGCGALAGGGIDVSSFTCADEGPNTVTLTVGDLNGNASSCTATVTVNVQELVMEGEDDNCISETFSLQGGQTINDLVFDGQLIGQVIIGANTIDAVQVDVYKSNNTIENLGLSKYLSKRISLTMLKSGSEVQPDTDPVYVRLYYSREELDALLAADPAASEATLTVVKTDNDDCGTGYEGFNATTMNTTVATVGCTGNDRYLEFFTGTFSTFYLFSNDTSLPVELVEFTATVLPKQRVRLDWRTLTEAGNSHFELERSTDGRAFTYLGEVAGAGDSADEQQYAYIDENPVTGVNYYRLRQVDLDGTATLSEVQQVTVSGAAELAVFPNPTAAELRVKGYDGGPVRIINQQGQLVLRQTISGGEAIQVEHLPSGVYLLQLPGASLRWVKE